MKKIKMKSQNEYIGDDSFIKLLEHYKCPMPLSIIKMRFAGAICSPNLELRPTDVISSFWPSGQEPRLETKKEAELFFKFFMGLWDKIFTEIKINKIRLEKERSSSKEEIKETCYRRYDEIEAGYVEGFWGGKENLKIPAYLAEIIDSLSDLANVYKQLAQKAEKAEDIDTLRSSILHTDKMVEKAIEFIIENSVLPRIEELKRQVN